MWGFHGHDVFETAGLTDHKHVYFQVFPLLEEGFVEDLYNARLCGETQLWPCPIVVRLSPVFLP